MEKFSKECYKTFSETLSEEEFARLFSSLGELKQRDFGRACLMYQRAMKCKSCDSDVCIALLCSAVEAVSEGPQTIVFKDWLMKNRLAELVNRNQEQIKKSIDRAYQDYVNSEVNREGFAYNFRKFLMKYCPLNLRTPPIEVYKGRGDLFDIALSYIYSRFRSLFLHKARGLASFTTPIDEETGEPVTIIAAPLLDRLGRNLIISVELTKITSWFSDVVKNSLLQYLHQQ